MVGSVAINLQWIDHTKQFYVLNVVCRATCAEPACSERECCDKFLTTTTKSVASFVDKNDVGGRCSECSQASITVACSSLMFSVAIGVF